MQDIFTPEPLMVRLKDRVDQTKEMMLGSVRGSDLRGDLSVCYGKALVAYDDYMMSRAYELIDRSEALARKISRFPAR